MSLNQELRMIRHRENILSDDKLCKICYQIMYTGLQLRNCIHAFHSHCLVLYSQEVCLFLKINLNSNNVNPSYGAILLYLISINIGISNLNIDIYRYKGQFI